MLGRQLCKARKIQGAIESETFTGRGKKETICEVGTRLDIRHFVWVKNLLAYETRITCFGQIDSEPKLIRFKPLHPGITEYTWTAKCILDNYQEYTFPPVSLFSEHPNGGDQVIKVDLEIDRLRPRGFNESASLRITVTA